MYRAGLVSAGGTFLAFLLEDWRGSGVAREESGPPPWAIVAAAALDSRFLRDSFLVRFSRPMVPVLFSSGADWVLFTLGSGLRGEETAGECMSSCARFWGSEEMLGCDNGACCCVCGC